MSKQNEPKIKIEEIGGKLPLKVVQDQALPGLARAIADDIRALIRAGVLVVENGLVRRKGAEDESHNQPD